MGDIDGDGLADLVVGATGIRAESEADRVGTAYVVLGRRTGFEPVLDLATLPATGVVEIRGLATGDAFGFRIDGAGDHRRCTLDGTDGFRIDGIASGDQTGLDVVGGRDLNGDGSDDPAIGSRFADPEGRTTAGTVHVLFGSTTPFAARLSLADLDGPDGFAGWGGRSGGRAGQSLAMIDLDDDGLGELVIGVIDESRATGAGRVYVLRGQKDGFAPVIDLQTATEPDVLLWIGEADGDIFGGGLAGLDGDGDGIDDLVIGASFHDGPAGSQSGRVYLVPGLRADLGPDLGAVAGVLGTSDFAAFTDARLPVQRGSEGDDLLLGGDGQRSAWRATPVTTSSSAMLATTSSTAATGPTSWSAVPASTASTSTPSTPVPMRFPLPSPAAPSAAASTASTLPATSSTSTRCWLVSTRSWTT